MSTFTERTLCNRHSPVVFLCFLLILPLACSNSGTQETKFKISTDRNFLPGIGATLNLEISINGSPALAQKADWESSDSSVITIDESGRATAISIGTAIITGTFEGITENIELEVFPISGTGFETMDIRIIEFLKKFQIPGGSYAIVKDGKLVVARGYGIADHSTNELVQPEHLFRIASVSKPITAVAILKLIEDGQFNLNDKAFNLLSNLIKEEDVADPRFFSVTINQLLHHTAGWDRNIVADPMFRQQDISDNLNIEGPPTARQVVKWLAAHDLDFTPGARFTYHNVNYAILGRVIEETTGMTYEDYVKKNIFLPMGITEATIGRTLKSQRFPNEVAYYNRGLTGQSIFPGQGQVPLPYGGMGGALETMDSHGGWIMSAIDLARFGASVDTDKTVSDFLSPEYQSIMTTDPGFGYGAGWFVNPGNWSHTGGIPGSAAICWVSKNSNFVIVGALNGTPVFGTQETAEFYNEYVNSFIDIAKRNTLSDKDLFDQF